MKISDLLCKLEKAKQEHGDLPVVFDHEAGDVPILDAEVMDEVSPLEPGSTEGKAVVLLSHGPRFF